MRQISITRELAALASAVAGGSALVATARRCASDPIAVCIAPTIAVPALGLSRTKAREGLIERAIPARADSDPADSARDSQAG